MSAKNHPEIEHIKALSIQFGENVADLPFDTDETVRRTKIPLESMYVCVFSREKNAGKKKKEAIAE